jgi:hypothetical protein
MSAGANPVGSKAKGAPDLTFDRIVSAAHYNRKTPTFSTASVNRAILCVTAMGHLRLVTLHF